MRAMRAEGIQRLQGFEASVVRRKYCCVSARTAKRGQVSNFAVFLRNSLPVPGLLLADHTPYNLWRTTLVDIPNPVLRAHVTKALRSWLSRLQTIVDQAQARGETQPGVDPKAVATLIVASLEGAPMMSRIQRGDEALQRVQAHLNRYLDEEVAGS
jgi:hypothetical protein